MWSQSHHHLLAVSLHWLPVKYRVHFKICSLTYRALHEEQPVYLHSLIATSLPSRSLRLNRGITLSVPRIRTNWHKGLQLLHSFSLEQPSTLCPFSHLQKTSQNIPFRLGLSPVDTGVPNGWYMLRNSLNDFVFEHRSGCCTTEPDYAGDNGAIEI